MTQPKAKPSQGHLHTLALVLPLPILVILTTLVLVSACCLVSGVVGICSLPMKYGEYTSLRIDGVHISRRDNGCLSLKINEEHVFLGCPARATPSPTLMFTPTSTPSPTSMSVPPFISDVRTEIEKHPFLRDYAELIELALFTKEPTCASKKNEGDVLLFTKNFFITDDDSRENTAFLVQIGRKVDEKCDDMSLNRIEMVFFNDEEKHWQVFSSTPPWGTEELVLVESVLPGCIEKLEQRGLITPTPSLGATPRPTATP